MSNYSQIFEHHPEAVLVFQQDEILYGNTMALELFDLPDFKTLKTFTPFHCITRIKPVFTQGHHQWEKWLEQTFKHKHTQQSVFCRKIKESASLTTWSFTLQETVDPSPVFLLFIREVQTPDKQHLRDLLDLPEETVSIPLHQEIISLAQHFKTLKESEHFYRTMIEKSPDIIMKFDRDLRYVYLNDNSQKASGVLPAEFIGKKIYEKVDDIPDEIIHLWHESLKEVLQTGQENRVEFKFPNGVWLDWYLVPEFNKKGDVEAIFGISRDITYIKKVENELKYSQQKLYSLAEASPDIVTEFDREMRHLYCSNNILIHSGIPAFEFIGKTHREMDYPFPEELIELWEHTVQWVFEHRESQRVEFTYPNERSYDWYVIPNWDDQHQEVLSVFGFARDITPLKSIQSKLHSLAEASPDVIFEFDRQVRILYVSKNITDHTGLPPAEFVGKTHWEIDYPYSEDLINFWEKTVRWVFKHGESKQTEFKLPTGTYWDWYVVPNWDSQHKEVLSVWSFSREITDRKQAEEEILLSKNKLSFAINIAHMAFWEVDLETGTFEMNQRLANVYGLSFEHLPFRMKVQDFLKTYIVEEDQHWLIENHKRLVEAKEKNNTAVEFRIIVNGKIHFFKSHGQLIEAFNKEGYIYYGTVQDITEFKEREEELKQYRNRLEELVKIRTQALRKSEESLQDAMNLAKLGTWEFFPDTQSFLVSPTFYDIVGIPRGHCKKCHIYLKDFIRYIHPDDLPKVSKTAVKTAKAHSEDFTEFIEYRLISRTGKIHTILTNIKILLDKETKHKKKMYGIIQDITELRATEREKERLITIAENTPDIILSVNKNYKIVYSNQAGLRFFGEDIITQETYAYSTDKARRTIPLFTEKGLQTALKKGNWTGDYTLISRDGYEIPVSQVIIVLYHSDGSIESISTIIRDISKQKEIEKDLRFKKQELDTFVYRASHDLKGPIATLQGLNKVAMHDLESQPNALSFFRMYNKEVEKLHNILITLIDITRIKDRELEQVDINFEHLIEKSLQSLSAYPGFDQVNFTTNVSLLKPYKGDPHLLNTIFHSLFQNAIDYKDADKETHVLIYIYEPTGQNKLILEVSDNGLGIEKDIQDKVFDMFYRGHEESQGPGLGLYMVKNIVDRLSGRITLKSELGKGTTFRIILPFS